MYVMSTPHENFRNNSGVTWSIRSVGQAILVLREHRRPRAIPSPDRASSYPESSVLLYISAAYTSSPSRLTL